MFAGLVAFFRFGGVIAADKVALHKKCSFSLRISSVNVTKSLMENFNGKLHFCAVWLYDTQIKRLQSW